MSLIYLQNYWWLLTSVLGALLVFLLFVQGGQSMIFGAGGDDRREKIVAAMGSKWELTYTTLVVFGGAMFAAFPLFYSTSFGGAYWLWILILFSFVLQAVSYEYRKKQGNVYGRRTYDAFLVVNGFVGCVLLGVAVSMFYFGADFTVTRGNLADGGNPVVSQWGPTHGFEAIFSWRNLVLGVAVFFLARMQASLYMLNRLNADQGFRNLLRVRAFMNGGVFVIFFLWFLGLVLTTTGYRVVSDGFHTVSVEATPYIYAKNLVANWWIAVILLVGVVLVLYGLIRSVMNANYRCGIWFTGSGTFLAVLALLMLAGYGDVAFLPSTADPMSSLTIRNASSSVFTLTVMSFVSILVPFVVAYIWAVWRKLDRIKI